MNAGRLLHVGLQVYNFISRFVADRRAAEEQKRKAFAERHRQAQLRAYLEDPTPSGVLGAARLGTIADAVAAGLVNGGRGILLGALHGIPLTYVGQAHGVINAMTGAGKGLYGTGHILANWFEGLLIVPELKNGEALFMSVEHRAKRGPVYLLNPHKFLKLRTTSFDPCVGIKDAAKSGRSMLARAKEVAVMLLPEPERDAGEDNWASGGATQFFCMFACETAAHRPEACTLTDAYLFGERGNDEILADLEQMADSDAGGEVASVARKFISMIRLAPKQWEAIRDAHSRALAPYAPGEGFAEVTAAGGLDIAQIKSDISNGQTATIYIVGDGGSALVDGPWMALVINALIDAFYRAPGTGKCLLWIEELLALPRLRAVERALNLYRSGGIQVVAMIQSRGALVAKYGREAALNFELQAGWVRAWIIEEAELLRDYEYLSGKTSVVVRHFSAQDSAFQQAGFGLGEVSRPLLTSDEIRLLGLNKQLLRVPGCPLLVIDLVPWTAVKQYATALRDPRTLTRDTVITLPPSPSTEGDIQ